MIKTSARTILLLIAGAMLIILTGCSSHYSGYGSDGSRAYYDQYVDRPGYYDFGRPVIFMPEEAAGVN